MATTRRRVEVGGYPVTYEAAGAGEPVVMVHGLSGSTRWWSHTVPALVQRYQVFLVDLPGFGSMWRARGRFVLAEAADWLRSWMEAVGLPQANLVGHSMGGYICMRLAARSPEAVSRLVLVNAAGVPSGRSMLSHVVPVLREGARPVPSYLPILVHDGLRAGPFTVLRLARELMIEDVRDDLKRIEAPTLIIWGEKDALVPLSLGRVLRERITSSRLLVLKGARHAPMIEKPGEFNRALLAFLAGQPGGE